MGDSKSYYLLEKHQRIIRIVADLEHRSRSNALQLIIEQWWKKNRAKYESVKAENETGY